MALAHLSEVLGPLYIGNAHVLARVVNLDSLFVRPGQHHAAPFDGGDGALAIMDAEILVPEAEPFLRVPNALSRQTATIKCRGVGKVGVDLNSGNWAQVVVLDSFVQDPHGL